MSTENEPSDHDHDHDLERLVAGEQDHLPPAPEGAPDDADSRAPEDVFTAPAGNTPYADRRTVDDNRTPEDEET
ncbi:hypothetical protein AB3M83_09565 [Microbacterium sp. 179-B 1A2 NHS]|uniref:hypothetical protein n=1 Tax=Microbacterium sp. 179-B 1A2 NHS TaxID=3142383 RepID=UPI0039A3318D